MMTKKIKEQILAVRDTGEANMFDSIRFSILLIAKVTMNWLFI